MHYNLIGILLIALCAVIAGTEHWTEVVEFGCSRQQWLAGFLKLPNGIPSHDTFTRVFRLINPDAQESACHQWLRDLVGRVQGAVAIDGKTVCGPGDGGRPALHIVSAWACESNTLMGQDQNGRKIRDYKRHIPHPSPKARLRR